MTFQGKHRRLLFLPLILLTFGCIFGKTVAAQDYIPDVTEDSARSDKLTGGSIKKAALAPGAGNVKITVNVPSFQMTLWQNGKELAIYPIGVGLKEYPIAIGDRFASEIIWNPSWIPPDSDWLKGVKAGEVILPTDKRNPLGKLKIPLGYGYLIHQAKGVGDLGSLVSHGCVRVMQSDLYDLSEKIVAARSLSVSDGQISRAKTTKKTLVAKLEPEIPVEITYDTLIVEAGKLYIYPDVYEYKTNTPEKLRAELESSGVDASKLNDSLLKRMLNLAQAKRKFVVDVKNIENGKVFPAGRTEAVIDRKTR